MEKIFTFKVINEFDKRIDIFLKEKLNNLSRSFIQFLITSKKVKVNNFYVKPSYELKKDDIVECIVEELPIYKSQENYTIEIIHQDDSIILIDKPAGIKVHPAGVKDKENTVVGFLSKYLPKDDKDKLKPGVVHRLDKDTSGIMVLAKTLYAKEFLKKEFKGRKVKKTYLAIVKGTPPDYGKISGVITKYKKISNSITGKESYTEFKVLKSSGNFSLVEVYPLTGRTHQIRNHFYKIGYPILGERLYSSQKAPSYVTRQMLHSLKIGFIHPDKKNFVEYSCKLPDDFRFVLKKLGLE